MAHTTKYSEDEAPTLSSRLFSPLAEVVGFLGGEEMLGQKVSSELDAHAMILARMPSRVARHISTTVPNFDLATISARVLEMSLRDLERAIAENRRLTIEHGAKIWCFAEMVLDANEFFGSYEASVQWLLAPLVPLAGRCPVDFLSTQPGRNLVKSLIGRIQAGMCI